MQTATFQAETHRPSDIETLKMLYMPIHASTAGIARLAKPGGTCQRHDRPIMPISTASHPFGMVTAMRRQAPDQRYCCRVSRGFASNRPNPRRQAAIVLKQTTENIGYVPHAKKSTPVTAAKLVPVATAASAADVPLNPVIPVTAVPPVNASGRPLLSADRPI